MLPSALSQTAGPGAALRASLELRRPGCPGAPRTGGRIEVTKCCLAQSAWQKLETEGVPCLAAEGAWGCPGSGPGANRCLAEPLGPGQGQAWVLLCFSLPDPAARPYV